MLQEDERELQTIIKDARTFLGPQLLQGFIDPLETF